MAREQIKLFDRIIATDGLMGGRPTIRGLRFPVSDILELLASGMSEEQILEEHPILEKEDIRAVLLYSAQKVDEDLMYEWLGNLGRHQYISYNCQMAFRIHKF